MTVPLNNHMFRNFELRLDVMARNRSNGGVYVMTEYQEKGFPGKGFEIQVNISHTDRIRSGSIYHVMDLSYIPAKDDEWYPMIVAVEGDTITVTLKGEPGSALDAAAGLEWRLRYARPEDRSRHDRLPGARSRQHDGVRQHPGAREGLTAAPTAASPSRCIPTSTAFRRRFH